MEKLYATPEFWNYSDQGSQYTAYKYHERLNALGFTASMSRKGNAWDNAVAESLFSNLKNELIHHRRFDDPNGAKAEIFQYIELFYNRKRAHAALNYCCPVDYERMSKDAQFNLSEKTGLAHSAPGIWIFLERSTAIIDSHTESSIFHQTDIFAVNAA